MVALHTSYIMCFNLLRRSKFFIVLAPPIEHADTGQHLNLSTWKERGWCRLERAACDFLTPNTNILEITRLNHHSVMIPFDCWKLACALASYFPSVFYLHSDAIHLLFLAVCDVFVPKVCWKAVTFACYFLGGQWQAPCGLIWIHLGHLFAHRKKSFRPTRYCIWNSATRTRMSAWSGFQELVNSFFSLPYVSRLRRTERQDGYTVLRIYTMKNMYGTCMYVCLSACLSVCLSVCMYVCIYVCMYIYIYIIWI